MGGQVVSMTVREANDVLKKFSETKNFVRMLGEIDVEVNVVDARWNFGSLEVMVEPVAGRGQKWVKQDSVFTEPW